MLKTLELLSPASCRDARMLLGLPQAELANLPSVSLSAVRRFEAGESQRTAYALNQIAAALEREGVSFVGATRQLELR